MLLRKIFKALAITILTVLLLVITILLTINLPSVRIQLVKIINRNLQKKEIPVVLGALNAIKSDHISVEDILISGPENDTILYAANIDVRFALRTLLSHKITVNSFEARGLKIRLLQMDPDTPLNLVSAFSNEPDKSEKPEKDSASWSFDIHNLRFTSLDLIYNSVPQKLMLNLSLSQAELEFTKTNLDQKHLIARFIHFNGLNSALYTGESTATDKPDTAAAFPWIIEAADITIRNSSFKSGEYPETPAEEYKPKLTVSELESELSDIVYTKDQLGIHIIQTTFTLDNGFELKHFNGKLNSGPAKTVFNFDILTNESELHLNGESDTLFNGINGKNNKSVLVMTNSRIALQDLLYFKPDLSNAGWFKEYGKNPLLIDAKIYQNRQITDIDTFSLYQSKNIWLSIRGSLSYILEAAHAKDYDLKMTSSLGMLALKGDVNPEKEKINVSAVMNHLKPAQIIKQNIINDINGSVKANINGFSADKLFADFKINLYSVNIRDHSYDKINVTGNATPEHYFVTANITDSALSLELKTNIERDKSSLSAMTDGNFRIIPFLIGLGKDTLAVAGNLSGSFRKASENLNAAVEMSDISLQKPGAKSHLNLLQLSMASDSLNTTFKGNSDFMDLDFSMDGPLSNTGILITELSSYFSALASNFTLDSAFHTFNAPMAAFHADFRYHPVLNFITGDTSLKFSTATVQISSNEQKGTFSARIRSTGMHKGNLSVANFQTSMIDSGGIINAVTRADSIAVSSQFFDGIEFTHEANDNSHQGHTKLILRKQNDQPNSEIEMNSILEDSLLTVTIPSGQLLLNGTNWNTSSPELFHYNRSRGEFLPEVTLYTDSSSLEFATIKNNTERGFNVGFDKVALSSLLPSELITDSVSAFINGDVSYRTSGDSNLVINADLGLSKVAWSDISIARLGIKANYNSSGNNIFKVTSDVSLDSAQIHLKASSSSAEDRNFETSISALSLNIFKPFIKDAVSELSGTVSGDIKLNTSGGKPALNGGINLDDVRVRIAALNSLFRIPDDNINLSGTRVTFDRFVVLDSMNNQLFVDGNMDAVKSNIDISAPKMLVMNSTRENSQSFYGTILAGMQISIRGPIAAPRIQGNLSVIRGTEIYYENQPSYAIQDMTKTVTFISSDSTGITSNRKSQAAIMQQNPTISTKVNVDPEAIIHFKLQDQLYDISMDIQGGGTLNYNVFSNNQSNLTGIYEINQGNTDLKIKGFSRKNFSIRQGSTVRFIDQMQDPELQITAENAVTGKYKNPTDQAERIVEFNVVLTLTNRLSALNVLLTVTTEDQYLMSIINSMSPEEQMKQAVSLLLFETINIPGIYTSSNQVTDQVNQIVESQLNSLTQASIKNVDISLGVNSYTTPTAGGAEETQTSLSYGIKKDLFNDRVSVEVSGRIDNGQQGGNDYSASNFKFQYRLDSAGSKYLQVYRQRSYEDILVGEVERTGFGIVFRKTFESIKDIWKGNKKKRLRK